MKFHKEQQILPKILILKKSVYLSLILFAISSFCNRGFSQACFTPWSSSTQYGPGTSCGGGTPFQTSYNGRNYTARYCNTNSRPDLNSTFSYDNWIDAGACASCNAVNPGSIGTAQSIVSGATPNMLTNTSAASGGNGVNYTYQWQVSTNNSTWSDISGANSTTYSPDVLTVNTYYRRKATSVACGDGYTSSVLVKIIIPVDTDGDGIFDHIDLDDDNDGILDTQECGVSNFGWSSVPSVSGNTATGSIFSINYTYTSSTSVQTTPNIFNHGIFPASYGIPNTTSIQNIDVNTNTLSFSQPILNPVLVFSSIGSSGLPVGIVFNKTIEVLWSSAVVVNSSTQITGTEGYAIVRINGIHSSVSFNYLVAEGYANFMFGADLSTQTTCDTDADGIDNTLDLDSDGDGCPDAIEGGAAFTVSNLTSDRLSGSVDANGIPVIATASGQTVGSSQLVAVSDAACPPCPDNDSDGVCNNIDLDDDNDGILDKIECVDTSASWDFEIPVVGSGNNIVGTTFQGWTCSGGGQINVIRPPYGGVPNTAAAGNQYVEVAGTGDFSRVYTVAAAGVVTVEIDFANWCCGVTESTQINIFQSDGTTLVAQSPVITTTPPADWNNACLHKGSVSAFLQPGDYVIKFFLGNFQAFDNVIISSATLSTCDTDGDGIINAFDLDSDADGCVDAIEGGAAFTTASLTGNRLSGSVNSQGVPVIAGASGQTVGTSQNVNVKDAACTIPTPIALLSFNAVYDDVSKTLLLKWATASETNNDYFTIERSSNGQDWQILSIKKGAGNSSHSLYYEMNDRSPLPGKSYYRLKQTDFDGQFTYSPIESVYGKDIDINYGIYPNPASDFITILPSSNIDYVEVVNSLGITVLTTEVLTSVSISELPVGFYFVTIHNTEKEVFTQKIIINRQ